MFSNSKREFFLCCFFFCEAATDCKAAVLDRSSPYFSPLLHLLGSSSYAAGAEEEARSRSR